MVSEGLSQSLGAHRAGDLKMGGNLSVLSAAKGSRISVRQGKVRYKSTNETVDGFQRPDEKWSI